MATEVARFGQCEADLNKFMISRGVLRSCKHQQQQQKQAFIISKQNWKLLCIFLCLETLKAENVRLKDDVTENSNENSLYQVSVGAETFGNYSSVDQARGIEWDFEAHERVFSTPQISKTGEFYALATFWDKSNTAQPAVSLYSELLPQVKIYGKSLYDGTKKTEWAEHALTAPSIGIILQIIVAEDRMEELSPIASGSLRYDGKEVLYTTYSNNDREGELYFSLDYNADGRIDKIVHQ